MGRSGKADRIDLRKSQNMRTLITKGKPLYLGLYIWLLVVVLLSAFQFNHFQILNILGFPLLILLPGLLTLLLLRFDNIDFWGKIGLAVAISILELMVVPLVGNMLLPLFGVAYPLARPVLLVELTLLVGGLIALNWARSTSFSLRITRYAFFENRRDMILAYLPSVFAVMAIAGAMRLNNGAAGTVTLVMLIGMGIYSAVLIFYSEKVGPNVIPVALFFISLALLLMTSLRGWFVTGHDIQREYRMLELTKSKGIWAIANFRDAYNACMSITILPTVFANVLKMLDQYVYKVLFQVIFATVPGIIYLTTRRYVSSAIALLSTLYFVSFPTFFTDMPFLNRQEIAFVFLMLMFYLLFDERIEKIKRQIIFVVFGVGMVLSHYSTTYTVVAMLIFLVLAQPVVRWLARFTKKKGWFANSAISGIDSDVIQIKPLINVWMVVIIIIASFLWSSVLTNTASNSISRVVAETLRVIGSNAKEDAKAGEVSYNLLSWQKVNPEVLLKGYENSVVDVARAKARAGTYYPLESYSGYQITTSTIGALPLTSLGRFLASTGVDVSAFNSILRQASAKLLQILILIGLVSLLFSKKFFKKQLELEYVLLSVAGLLFMASQVILPILSVEYGLLRAFQQSLLFLGLFIVVGSLTLVTRFSKRTQILFASSIAILFFLTIVGVFTQTLGGYDPQLHLNNAGQYYDIFYLHSSEISGIDWLTQEVKKDANNDYQSEVQTDRFALSRVDTLTQVNTLNDIFPGLIRRGSFVYLGFANVTKLKANISYSGTNIIYNFPIEFLDKNESLLYNSGGAKIYR